VTSIAAPITADEDTAIAAIAVAGPTYRLTSERVARLVPLVIESAANINAKFMPMTRTVSTAH
jgi:DNA-binding IclR family transcriptional regulator